MADRSWALPVRMVTAALALACAVAVTIAIVMLGYYKGLKSPGGDPLISVLVFPLLFVAHAGPPLLAMGMASRSRSMFPALVALVLAGMIAAWFVPLHVWPWDYKHWRADPGEEQNNLFLSILFGIWPLTAGAGFLWLLVNRRRGAP